MQQLETALEQTAAWYRHLHEKIADACTLYDQQVDRFIAAASATASRSAA